MNVIVRAGGLLLVLLGTVGCGLMPDPPPQIPQSAYSGTGDLMAKCMQYGSESYCEREVWGGNER